MNLIEGAGISRSLFIKAAIMPKTKKSNVGLVRLDKSISKFMVELTDLRIRGFTDCGGKIQLTLGNFGYLNLLIVCTIKPQLISIIWKVFPNQLSILISLFIISTNEIAVILLPNENVSSPE